MVKIELVSKMTIFGLKITVNSVLTILILKSLDAEDPVPNYKFSNKINGDEGFQKENF